MSGGKTQRQLPELVEERKKGKGVKKSRVW